MNCGEVNALLDLLMDGELSDAQRRDMEAHGQTCPECAASIRSAMQLKALFAQMDSEVDVPLPAQAAWRGAVREESKRRRRGKRLRWIASAAAAVVALVGVGMTLNLRGAPKEATSVLTETAGVLTESAEEAYSAKTAGESAVSNAAPIRANSVGETAGFAVADSAVVEADGACEAEETDAEDSLVDMEEAPSGLVCAAVAQRAPACELCVHVTDVETACERIRDLVREYEGEADIQQMEDGGANVYVDIDADGAGDFLSAVAPMDASGQIGELPALTGEGRVLVLLSIIRQEE